MQSSQTYTGNSLYAVHKYFHNMLYHLLLRHFQDPLIFFSCPLILACKTLGIMLKLSGNGLWNQQKLKSTKY